MKKFTEEELSAFDGSEPGKPLYFAYKGKVYDITGNALLSFWTCSLITANGYRGRVRIRDAIGYAMEE